MLEKVVCACDGNSTFSYSRKYISENMAASRVRNISMVLGRCMPSDVKNAAKLKIKLMEFDTNLNFVSILVVFGRNR